MIKGSFLIAFVFLLCSCKNIQIPFLSKRPEPIKFQTDENGKIIFYDVVSVDSVPRDTLWQNSVAWLKSILNEKEDKIVFMDYLSGTMEANTSFMVYVPSVISKIPHGKISYRVSIDVKDKKYRYIFTDFVFQFYKQDRTYKYVPVKGNTRPLENPNYPGWQNAWLGDKESVKNRVDGQIKNLKSEIVKMRKATVPVVKNIDIKSKDW